MVTMILAVNLVQLSYKTRTIVFVSNANINSITCHAQTVNIPIATLRQKGTVVANVFQ